MSVAAAPRSQILANTSESCVGREAEIGQVVEAFDAGRGTFVAVTGRAGIGKSTLLNTLTRRLRAAGGAVLAVRCRAGLASSRALADLGQGLLQHLCEHGSADLIAAAEELVSMIQGRAAPAPEELDPVLQRVALFDHLASLCAAISASRPMALVVHDVDAADITTRQLVSYLARVLTGALELSDGHGFRGVVAVTAERLAAVGADAEWFEGVNLLHLPLHGLDREGVQRFLASPAAVEHVMRVTAGVPRKLDALVHGDLDPQGPLATVSAAEGQLLQLLAVFGRPAGAETLRLLTGLAHDPLTRAIQALLERRLIEKLVVDGELRVGFSRLGDERAVYESLSADERRRLHAAVGAYLSDRGEDAGMEARAEHLLRGECEGAVDAALASGQRLEIALCFERAAELYARALQRCSAGETRRALLQRLCNLHQQTGQLDRAIEVAQQLKGDADDLEGAHRVAHLQLLRGDFAAARRELRALSARAGDGQPELLAALRADEAEAHFLAGECDAAVAAAHAGLELCESAAAGEDAAACARERLHLRNTLAKVHIERGQLRAAAELLQQNLRDAEALGDVNEESRANIQLGLLHLQGGDFDGARRRYDRARQLAEALGDHRVLGACLQHLGVVAERRRAYGTALSYYQGAVSSWKKVGHRSYLAWVGLDLGKLYLDLGDVARASAMVSLADRLADSEPPLTTRINVELLRGRIAEHQSRFGEARQRFSRALELARDGHQADRLARCRLHLAELWLRQDEPAAAARELEQLQLPGSGATRLRALLLRGRIALRERRLEQAGGRLAEALELADGLGDSEAGWQVHLLQAQLAREQGREAEAQRLLGLAAALEEQVRDGVPESLHQTLTESPERVALRAALARRIAVNPVTAPPARPPAAAGPQPPARQRHYPEIVGDHRRIRQLLAAVDKVAPTDATVLIRGESGTGKELVADAIHRRSGRTARPLVKVNCGALVESLLLSELFGHERGAFTGATGRKVGRFERADGGTIFLDEIGDISPKTQVALLRVLQERSFERVGGTSPVRVDVRIILATNRDLEKMVADGRFREDLYYRIKGVQLDVPPLRERSGDVSLLAEHLLTRIARERGTAPRGLSEAARELLARHRWPGNVRELENVLRSVSLFCDGETIDAADFADYRELGGDVQLPVEEAPAASAIDAAYDELRNRGIGLRELKKRVEGECIRQALAETEGNITRAAELLQMKRPRLSQLVREHGIR